MEGLAASIESALGAKKPISAKETYSAGSDSEALNLVRDAARRGVTASATVDGGFSGLANSVGEALASDPKIESGKPKTEAKRGDTLYQEANLAPIVGLGETALHTASGIGNSIIGGWRGLATLATGGSLEDATKAVHGEDANSISKQYQPETPGGKIGAEVMGSKFNPLNWPGMALKKGGELSQDYLGASPEVAAGLETVGNAALIAAGARAGSKVPALEKVSEAEAVPKPRIKGKVAEIAEPEFTESVPVASEGQKLPQAEQIKRAEVLRRVGVERVRKSAVEGDRQAAADDFQNSRLNNSGGQHIKATLEHEREALAGHAENIIQDTGGTLGMDESARMSRGSAIIAPLDSFKKWFDTNIKGLYKAADEKAGGVAVDLPEVHNFVKDHRANFLGTTEGKALLEGVTERMKSLGMVDAEGNSVPVTVAQAEKLNQYLGEVWTPRTGRLIGQMKDNILEGVTRNAGEDIYKQARALRAMRAATLDDPQGISKIMDASGPEGINRSVPVEKIADAVTGMPVDQLKHVVKTLDNVPKELQPKSQAALAEIKSHFANKVLEIGSSQSGQWNAKGVTKYLRSNAEKLKSVFSPEELAKMNDLNEAGQILAKDQSYPGAAVQEHNLVQRGAMGAIRGGSAAVGGAVAGPAGAAIGGLFGDVAARKAGEAVSLRSAQKRVVRLSDFPK